MSYQRAPQLAKAQEETDSTEMASNNGVRHVPAREGAVGCAVDSRHVMSQALSAGAVHSMHLIEASLQWSHLKAELPRPIMSHFFGQSNTVRIERLPDLL